MKKGLSEKSDSAHDIANGTDAGRHLREKPGCRDPLYAGLGAGPR